MSIERCSLKLLRACNVQSNQLALVLQPFGGSMPTTNAEFSQLSVEFCRRGHVAEGAFGNIS